MGGRFRTIDPAMRTSPILDSVSVLARLVFVYLISEADDEGRLLGDATSVRVACFPRVLPSGVTSKKLEAAVAELVARGLIVEYAADGQEYLAVRGWKDGGSWAYQYVPKAKSSRFPAPPDGACLVRANGRGGEQGRESSGTPTGQGPDASGGSGLVRAGSGSDPAPDGKRDSTSPSPAHTGDVASRLTNGKAKDGTTTPGKVVRGEYVTQTTPPDAIPPAEGARKLLAAMGNSKPMTATGGAR